MRSDVGGGESYSAGEGFLACVTARCLIMGDSVIVEFPSSVVSDE